VEGFVNAIFLIKKSIGVSVTVCSEDGGLKLLADDLSNGEIFLFQIEVTFCIPSSGYELAAWKSATVSDKCSYQCIM